MDYTLDLYLQETQAPKTPSQALLEQLQRKQAEGAQELAQKISERQNSWMHEPVKQCV